MLAELRAIRELQRRQEEELGAGDMEAVARLCEEGDVILRALPAVPAAGDHVDDRDAVRAVAADVAAAQERLERLAADARASLAGELGALAPGREARAGYRPPPRDTARLFDGAR